jgi:signal transduction histidine kinase
MIDLTSETIKDVQRITSELRPSILDDIGLSAALEWYCVEFSKRTGLQLHMDINDVQTEDVQINLSIYRILQESLTNVIRHSGAKNVIVSLTIIEKNLVLLIQDDGAGITPAQVNSMKSFGILGMIERVKQSGGFMEISSLDNGGTLVSVHIPLN